MSRCSNPYSAAHASVSEHGKSDWFPLLTAGAGRYVKVVSFEGGEGLQERLAAMGLRVGMHVKVISGCGGGQPMLIAAGDNRLVIGCGMAAKILVSRDTTLV